MCYASPVMLRGRCSCAISDPPTPSLFATPSLFRTLSPTIPVHPRTAPVSPIIPVHTQKQGGGGYICSLFVLPSSVPGARPACPELLGDPVGVSGACPGPVGMVSPLPPFSFSPLATRHSRPSSVIPGGSNRLENLAPNCKLSAVNCRLSPLTPIILAPLATAALRVVPAPICTTTSRIHVGAPTISCAESVCRASRAGNHYAHRTQLSRAGLTSGAPTALRSKNSQDGSCRSSNCRLSTV